MQCLNQCIRVIRTPRLSRLIEVRTKSTAQKLAIRIYGPSPTPDSLPIFVLHDCLGTKKNWENVCKRLTSIYKTPVIAVDARNHGDSPYCGSHDYRSLAADVLELITNFAIHRSIIIGHSMGGRTAMLLALQEPSRIAGLVVLDISPVSTSTFLSDSVPKIINVMMSVDFKGLDLDKAKEAAKSKIMENRLFQHEAETQALLVNVEKLSNQSYGWKFNLPTLQKHINDIVDFPDIRPGKRYVGPALFIAGKLSYCVPPEDLAGIHQLFPSARLLYIDGVGHNIHLEDPNGLISAVVNSFDYNSMIKT